MEYEYGMMNIIEDPDGVDLADYFGTSDEAELEQAFEDWGND